MRRSAWAWALAASALLSSTSTASPTTTVGVLPAASFMPTAQLPRMQGDFAPALTELAGAAGAAGVVSGNVLTQTETCAECHADATAQWASSAHAFASFNNPIYRTSVDRFRRVVGNGPSRFCGGCHDVALLVDGAMMGDVVPTDARAYGGITCRVCHGIDSARPDGNGSYRLSDLPIPLPTEGDAESLRIHRERVALSPLRTPALCGSCHRSFLTSDTGNASHLTGQDDLGAFRRSAYAGSLAARVDEPVAVEECRTCHMPLEAAPLGDAAAKNNKVHSHRFAGANTWLAAMRRDAAQVAAVQTVLRGAASIDVAGVTGADGEKTLPADGAPVHPGERLLLDVVVRNEHVGHRFPGGVLDAQDTWIEVRVIDSKGRTVGRAGVDHESSGANPTAHVLRALQADEKGRPVTERETDRFRTPVYDQTIAPRDARVVRYLLLVPKALSADALPLRVTARLRHRSRNGAIARATCADSRTPRGNDFAQGLGSPARRFFDACAAEPVTDIAVSETWLGDGGRSRNTAGSMPVWRRLYGLAQGLSHGLEDDVQNARASLHAALDHLSPGQVRERAMLLELSAEVAIRQGRTDEAIDRLGEAEVLAPSHPAIARARGDALAGIWRWKDAVAPFWDAARASPVDDSVWARLAIAGGSADEPGVALEAAQTGLALSPRDADLLRVQAIALDRLGAPSAGEAREAFARFRPPDDAPAIKNACARTIPGCALERLPVHVHPLLP